MARHGGVGAVVRSTLSYLGGNVILLCRSWGAGDFGSRSFACCAITVWLHEACSTSSVVVRVLWGEVLLASSASAVPM